MSFALVSVPCRTRPGTPATLGAARGARFSDAADRVTGPGDALDGVGRGTPGLGANAMWPVRTGGRLPVRDAPDAVPPGWS